MNYNCVLDISKYQGCIDGLKVKNAGIKGIILRAGYGREAYQKDNKFDYNLQQCINNNIPVAIYWYSYAQSVDEALVEASVCYDIIKDVKNVKFVAFDLEDKSQVGLGVQINTNMANAFLDFYKSKRYKTKLYTNPNWRKNYVDVDAVKLHGHGVWLAWYTNATPDNTNLSNECDIWQFCSDGRIDGIDANVDMNVCYDNSFDNNVSAPVSQNINVDVEYRVRTKVNGWLSPVTNLNDYAGYGNNAITDIAIKVSAGSVRYRVHIEGGSWLPCVTGYNINDNNNGYAGNGQEIDAIEIYYITPNSIRPYKRAKYHVTIVNNNNYYNWQYDNETGNSRGWRQDGYSGKFGESIKKFQIIID